MSTSKTSPVIIPVSQWNPSAKKYMSPKVNDKGAKTVNIISTQTNRSIHITLPLLMTWGIADFVDQKTGESDGRFKMSLNFPNEEYGTPETKVALEKLKEFEEQILSDAVIHSEIWFGKKQSREIVEYGFFPFLTYSKNKDTKAIDYSKPPALRPKIQKYDEDWKIEIYDTKYNLLFPSPNHVSPIELVPKQSNVACVIACTGLWMGGKGWGTTWKVVQAVVKPQIMENVFGKCHIQLSEMEVDAIEDKKPAPTAQPAKVEKPTPAVVVPQVKVEPTFVENSDNEEEAEVPVPKKVLVKAPVLKLPEPESEPVVEAEPEPVVEQEEVKEAEVEAPKKKIIKKIVKKV
jgi:hypothetical protein